MKSNSNIRPKILLNLGNGAWHYNYNIVERTEENETGGSRLVYDYDTVEVWNNPTYAVLASAVIREEVSESEELSLINDYNAATVGLLDDEEAEAEAIAKYKEYLMRVRAIKKMVRNDLANVGE